MLVGRRLKLGSVGGCTSRRPIEAGWFSGYILRVLLAGLRAKSSNFNVDCGNSVDVEIEVCNGSGDWLTTAAMEIADGYGRCMWGTGEGTFRFYLANFLVYIY